jgi:hypothetical protein
MAAVPIASVRLHRQAPANVPAVSRALFVSRKLRPEIGGIRGMVSSSLPLEMSNSLVVLSNDVIPTHSPLEALAAAAAVVSCVAAVYVGSQKVVAAVEGKQSGA